MNHIYRVVYNTASQTYQAVPEISKGKHKSCAEKTSAAASKSPTFAGKLRALCAALLALTCPFALAAPTGGAVSAGQAAIHQAGNITDIQQSSQNAAINWQNFSIGAHETVNFHQPNAQSLTLNRVIGNERSIIDGAMNANGKVFISNPNGMLIGRDAQINVGSLVATTAQISNDDFMNGRYQFTNAKGEIENLGNITVPQGGVVALIAPIVKHSGTITAPKAHTLLASADSFSITLPDNANFAYTLDKGTLQGLVDNGGAILADGGRVVLTAKGVDSVKKSLIKHTGVIEANTVQNNKGVIELLGDLDNSALNVSGSLKAEAKGADKGGFVETSASQVKIHDSAVVSTKSEQGQTGTWLIDPTDFTIYAGTGDKIDTGMGADTLSGNLGNTDITIQTVNTGSEQGDINVNAPISWSRNKLTLSAHNDIHINANLNGSGTAKLALEYGQGSKDGKYKAVVDGKEITLDNDYYLDKNTPLKDRTVKVNLPEGKNFSVKKGSNGETIVFDVIHQMPEIIKNANGDWESKFTTHNIAFGADMDVGYTKGYDGFAGWQLSNGNNSSYFEWGPVAGLGHTVKGLSLHNKKDSQPTGLFQNQGGNAGYLQGDNTGYLRDIGVIDVNVRSDGKYSYTGGLVGIGQNISNSYATGNVSSTGQYADAGGLVGRGQNISNSYATGDVSSAGDDADTGGLVGRGQNISNSYATSNVSSTGDGANTGGLVGGRGQNISNSYATGNVSSTGDDADTGGLVGTGGEISNSYATGNVSSTGHSTDTGGLAGSGSSISNSYATGDVSSAGVYADAGGLVGYGYNISNSYANNTSIKATGKRSAMSGLIAYYYGKDSKDSFFNQDKHPTLPAIGKYADHADKSKIVNVTGKTEAELKQKSTFTDAGWDFEKVWYMNDGEMPHLQAHKQGTIVITPTNPNKSDLAINAHDLKKTYDGKTVATESDLRAIAVQNGHTDIVSITGLKNGDSLDSLGTLRYDGTWKGAKDAGKYSILPTGLTGGQKYEIKYGEGSLTVGKRPLEIMLIGEKTYDASNLAKIDKNTKFTQNGLIEADIDKIGLGGSVVLKGKDVGVYQAQDTTKFNLTGEASKNYDLKTVGTRWKINPKKVGIITAKEYDGTNIIDENKIKINPLHLILSDLGSVSLAGFDDKHKGKFSDVNVGNQNSGLKISNFHQLRLVDKNGNPIKNYQLDESKSLYHIAPQKIRFALPDLFYHNKNKFRVLTNGENVMSLVDDKIYDGTNSISSTNGKPDVGFVLANKDYQNGKLPDGLSVTFDASFKQSSVGKDIPIVISNIKLFGENARNYQFDTEKPYTDGVRKSLVANINPRKLSIYSFGVIGHHHKDNKHLLGNASIDSNELKNIQLKWDYGIGSNRLLPNDKLSGDIILVKVADRKYKTELDGFAVNNLNYEIEYQPLYLNVTGAYSPSEYDPRILAMANPNNIEDLNKKEEPSNGIIGTIGDIYDNVTDMLGYINVNPLEVTRKITEMQLDAVSGFFDDTSRKWVGDFVNEISSQTYDSNIDFNDPYALIKKVNEESDNLMKINQYHTARKLLIEGLREAKDTIDTPREIIGLAEYVIGIGDSLSNFKDVISDHIKYWDDYKNNMNEMHKLISFWEKGGIRVEYDEKRYSRLIKLAPPTLRNRLMAAWKDSKTGTFSAIVSEIKSAGDIILPIVEQKERQSKMIEFLAKSKNQNDIAKIVIQQKIISDLVSQGKISPEQLANMYMYDTNGAKVIEKRFNEK